MNASSSTKLTPAAPRHIGQLPGPFAWPLVGNVLQLNRRSVHQSVEGWARRYGKLFRICFGPQKVLVVADSALVAAILRDRPDGFRRPAVTEHIAREMGGLPGLFDVEGAQWRRQRSVVMAAFAPHAVKAYFPKLVEVAARLQRRWLHAAATGVPVALTPDLKRYTVDIIAGLAFGTDVNTLESGDDVIQRHLDTILPAIARRSVSLFPYWRYVKLPVDRRLDRSVAVINTLVGDLIVQARSRIAAEPALRERPTNLLEAIIGAADRDDSGVDDTAVAGNVLTMLLAGEDTTATSLGWLLWLLLQNPHAYRRARDEVRSVAPALSDFSVDRMDALDYLDACIQESMRIKPVAPFMPLEALRGTTVGDVQVPAGALLWCVLRHDSVDAANFPDPGRFEPERWLAGGAAGDVDKRVMAPFGSGPRMCPGRYLALLEMKVAMAMLLGAFDIDSVTAPGGKAPLELMGFVMAPVGLQMRLTAATVTAS